MQWFLVNNLPWSLALYHIYSSKYRYTMLHSITVTKLTCTVLSIINIYLYQTIFWTCIYGLFIKHIYSLWQARENKIKILMKYYLLNKIFRVNRHFKYNYHVNYTNYYCKIQLSGLGSYYVLFSSQTFSITLNTNNSGQFGRTNEGIWNEDRLKML